MTIESVGAINFFRDPEMVDDPYPNARQHVTFRRGVRTCPESPLARTEAKVCVQRLLDRTSEIRISEERRGPRGARRYNALPTFLLGGLTHVNIELAPA